MKITPKHSTRSLHQLEVNGNYSLFQGVPTQLPLLVSPGSSAGPKPFPGFGVPSSLGSGCLPGTVNSACGLGTITLLCAPFTSSIAQRPCNTMSCPEASSSLFEDGVVDCAIGTRNPICSFALTKEKCEGIC